MPWPSPAELGTLGFAHVSYPASLMFRITATMQSALAALRRHATGVEAMTPDRGADAARAVLDDALELSRWQDIEAASKSETAATEDKPMSTAAKPNAAVEATAALRQRLHRRPAARTGHRVHRADAGREFSRTARQPRQLPRQRAPRIAAVRARRTFDRARAWLRSRDRASARGRGARQRRPDARDHGDLQRLVRSHSDAHHRCRRPRRCRATPALGRLDSHRRRPGGVGARLHQVGRPAGIGRRRAGIGLARAPHRHDCAARPRVCVPRCRAAGRGGLAAATATGPGAFPGGAPGRRTRGRGRGDRRRCSQRRSVR